uniref:rab11 family-interacting protein 1 n=1 Tax=Maylandia zebra TaxID=106582 RepID=UPI000D30599C|nr:rab11 family-interacting protein 1 [Maylandia zebra]
MSLTDQQWCPTSVQVTVLQARSLRIKGKSGTNDAYAVIQVGKEKYQTSVVEKCVAPVWKEEASFDLPQLNQGGGGSTLHVHVLHRALVGPDKLLGQAVINLSQLSEDKTRNKTEWFKLLDKTGKPDKDRGEVLLDIQFMRNNMTASMFDLSAAGKSRSRLGKFKDKVRGKKKESDSVTSVAPSFSQVLTDSEEEGTGDGEAATGKDGKQKKHKIKSLFSPKSNLQKSMSQSMSVLPGKNSTLTGSQSSGLNVDSSEGKKKFKFMIHKRSGSSGSKDSSSGREKQVSVEQSNLCINGSHVYCEEPPSRTSRISSNFSLASSGHGSMEDVPENSPPPEQQKAARQCSPWEEDEKEEEDTPEVENVKANVSDLERTIIEEETKEEKVKRQQERLESLAEDREKQEEEETRKEERKRIEAEEKIRRQERIRMEKEEKRRLEEQENQRAEEERLRKEEEKRREDEERARKQREEYERLLEEKMQQEEQRRLEEEERIRREEEERVRMEEEMKRRKEEEERTRKEKEEMERLEEERRLQEQEKWRIEEEERIRSEKKEEEARKLEKLRNAEEQEKRENKTTDEVRAAGKKPKVSSPAVTSTNPFDETFSSNPFEEIPKSLDSSTADEPTVQQRCHSAMSLVRSKTGSVDEKDLISTQREKRAAPQPPVRSQAGKQPHREQDVPARHLAQINKQSKDKDVKTVSVPPQRSVQMIAPLCRSPTDSKNSQSLMQSNNANGTTNEAKHSKRPAPSVPPPVGEKQSSEPKTSSNLGGAETKQVKVVCGLNPFEDDEDESELTAQDDTAVSSNTGSIHWPAAVSQSADKDAASQPKIKSSKTAHAPPPPAKNDISSNTLTNPGTERSHATGDRSAAAPDNDALQACDPYYESTSPGHVPVSPLQESQSLKVQNIVETDVKKDWAPTPSRRLQPVRPLNPLEQQGASVVQEENENKSTGIPSGLQDKTTVDDSGMKGPYSQLTREELISLILKQENQLSERDYKISELEQYIDNLLVRVIEEKPSILMSLTAMKKAA